MITTVISLLLAGAAFIIVKLSKRLARAAALQVPDQLPERREKEQRKAVEFYDAEVRFLRYDDERLQDTPLLRRDIINSIR